MLGKMILRRVRKLLAWVFAIAVVVLMASGAWWLLTVV